MSFILFTGGVSQHAPGRGCVSQHVPGPGCVGCGWGVDRRGRTGVCGQGKFGRGGGGSTPEMAMATVGTHRTGMHTYYYYYFYLSTFAKVDIRTLNSEYDKYGKGNGKRNISLLAREIISQM